jgi:hypothetical protein
MAHKNRTRQWRRHMREKRIKRHIRQEKLYSFGPVPHKGHKNWTWTDRYGAERQTNTWRDLWEWRDIYARKRWRTPQACSCQGCGNPRKWYNRVTRKEAASEMDYYTTLFEEGITKDLRKVRQKHYRW